MTAVTQPYDILTELEFPGVELHVLERHSGATGYSQDGGGDQQQLHPGRKEQTVRPQVASEFFHRGCQDFCPVQRGVACSVSRHRIEISFISSSSPFFFPVSVTSFLVSGCVCFRACVCARCCSPSSVRFCRQGSGEIPLRPL